MSIAAALAYEEEIEKLMRLVADDAARRAPAAILVNSNSTLEWTPIPPGPNQENQEFQEMMQRMRHRVAQEMAVPAHMLVGRELSTRQQYEMELERIRLRPDGGFLEEARFLQRTRSEQALSSIREADLREEPSSEATPVVKKYGRVLEP